ncbi:MAG TPA: hypothetical protein VKN99_10250 [Polyangia bacterium]|nr:hypothetical protein [Polyangia bacterium]
MKRIVWAGLALGMAACVHRGAGQPTAESRDPNAPYVVRGSEDFSIKMTARQADGLYRPELRVALEVKNTGDYPVWLRVEKDGYTLGQTAVKAGVATLADTAVLLEGQLGEGWYKVYVEEIVDGQRYPIKWYSLPVVQTESTGGRILAIHASYHRKHADLHDGTLRFIVTTPLEQPYTQLATEWVYEGRLVGEVARRWEMPSLWILQPLQFPVRVQLKAPYQLTDGNWDVVVFRDGNYEMHCPFVVRGGQYPGRLDCKQDEIPIIAAARTKALAHEAVPPDSERAMQVRALTRSPEVRRALARDDQRERYLELVKKYGGAQASTPSAP